MGTVISPRPAHERHLSVHRPAGSGTRSESSEGTRYDFFMPGVTMTTVAMHSWGLFRMATGYPRDGAVKLLTVDVDEHDRKECAIRKKKAATTVLRDHLKDILVTTRNY